MIFCNEIDYKNIESVRKAYPGAYEVVRVDGGWCVFFSAADLNTWRNQK